MSNLDLQIEAQASDAVEEFTLFPKLPVELRLKIWHVNALSASVLQRQ